jgi:phosphoglycolate phosphatase
MLPPAPGAFARARALLFDLDGTLIDSAADLGAAADRMRTQRGLPSLPLDTYRPMAGAGARGMLGIAFGLTPEHPDFAELREEFFRNYESAMTVRTRVFDGVAELIDRLNARGLPWGVVTNKARRFTEPLTRQMALFATAGAIVSGDTTGDDERDIVAGRAAGMPTIAACYGYLGAQADVAAWGADAVCHRPGDLPACLGW